MKDRDFYEAERDRPGKHLARFGSPGAAAKFFHQPVRVVIFAPFAGELNSGLTVMGIVIDDLSNEIGDFLCLVIGKPHGAEGN